MTRVVYVCSIVTSLKVFLLSQGVLMLQRNHFYFINQIFQRESLEMLDWLASSSTLDLNFFSDSDCTDSSCLLDLKSKTVSWLAGWWGETHNSNLGPVNSCLSFSSRRLSLAVVWSRSGALLAMLGEEQGEAAGEVSVELGLDNVPPFSRLSALEFNSTWLIDLMAKLLSTKLH